MYKLLLVVLLAMSMNPEVNAEELVEPSVLCSAKEHRQFDFWIGGWEVFDPSGKKVGENKIEATLNGCALQENWVSESPNRGHSFNIYDQTTKLWHQT